MSFSYDRYDRRPARRNRPVPGGSGGGSASWLPLALAIGTITVGFAAWIWKEHKDDGDDDHAYGDDDYKEDRRKRREEKRALRDQSGPALPGSYATDSANVQQSDNMNIDGRRDIDYSAATTTSDQQTVFGRVSDVIWRTSSPGQLFDGARKGVVAGVGAAAAGVAAAGAVVGKAIQGEPRDDFQDHERWSEEAEMRESEGVVGSQAGTVIGPNDSRSVTRDVNVRGVVSGRGKRRMIAVVVSAAAESAAVQDDDFALDHASILSHLPSSTNSETVQLVILIYAPHLKNYPIPTPSSATLTAKARTSSGASSYDNISTPGLESSSPFDASSNPPNAFYDSIQATALRLVADPTAVMPFTTQGGHVHILRHLAPNMVYMQESLCGPDGENVKAVDGWVGQVIVVVGAEGVGAGLVETETETEAEDETGRKAKRDRWWMDDRRVGLGKGVDVVEGVRLTEDWNKRVVN